MELQSVQQRKARGEVLPAGLFFNIGARPGTDPVFSSGNPQACFVCFLSSYFGGPSDLFFPGTIF
jgi:hypothetical protein